MRKIICLIFLTMQENPFQKMRQMRQMRKFFLNLIKFMSMNFKLINLMSMNFVNKQISYFFPLRCFLILCSAFLYFFVLVKSYRKKK